MAKSVVKLKEETETVGEQNQEFERWESVLKLDFDMFNYGVSLSRPLMYPYDVS